MNRVAIAGAGPAGLTCAIYLARAGWKVDVYANDENTESSLVEADLVENYPGFPDGEQGFLLLNRMIKQAQKCGACIHPEGVAKVLTDERKVVDTVGNAYVYDEYVEAIGCKRREFECPGIDLLPVHTCAICDGTLYGKNDKVVVIGGGDTAISSALYLSNIVGQVTVLVRKPQCRCTNQLALNALVGKSNAEIMYETTLNTVTKDGLGKPILHIGKANYYADFMLLGISSVFVCIGSEPNTIEHIGNGKVWRCGDCVEEHKQIAIAVGSGAKTALDIIGSCR